MFNAWLAALILVGTEVPPIVESRSLRLFVQTYEDLSRYSIEAHFTFQLVTSSGDILFFFPGAAGPDDLRSIVMDGNPIPPSRLSVGRHPRTGRQAFVLRAADAGIRPGLVTPPRVTTSPRQPSVVTQQSASTPPRRT